MSRLSVPQADPKAAYFAQRDEIDAAIVRVLESGRYLLGKETEAFEMEFSNFVGCEFGVAVGSGTHALVLALHALGIGDGKTVATVSHTAVATVAAIELAGAVPLLIDIDPISYTMNPIELERELAQSRSIAAIIVVHLYGQAAEIGTIARMAARHDVPLIEDCAQAHGAHFEGKPVGSFGTLGCFSFYPTKNLGAFGDGGMVTTNDAILAARLKSLREYGWQTRRHVSEHVGTSSRLDELQAAILRVKLSRLASDNTRRRAIAARYESSLSLASVTLPVHGLDSAHVFHQYVIRSSSRDGLRAALQEFGIGTNIHYPVPIHLQPAYLGRVAIASGGLGCTERAAAEIISLPMFPQLTEEQTDYTIKAILEVVEKGRTM